MPKRQPGFFDWDKLKELTKINDGLPSLNEIEYMMNHLKMRIVKKHLKQKNRATLCEKILAVIRPIAEAYKNQDHQSFVSTAIEDVEALTFFCVYEPVK